MRKEYQSINYTETMKFHVVNTYKIVLFCTVVVSLYSCTYVSEKVDQVFGNSEEAELDSDLKAKELELKERELALREQEKLNTEVSQTSFQANARVNGSAVQLRSDHSTTAQSLKSMKKNDLLQIIEEFVPDGNYGQAILKEKTDFYDEYYGNFSFSLPKGKAVMVEEQVEGNRYRISYMDAKTKSKGFAKINSGSLEFITGKAWYRVKREDGLTGWVFSEFVDKI